MAGSEKTSKLDVENTNDFRESCRINNSLLHLGRCLQSLKEGKGVNITRDSALTMILLGFMNENNNVVMLCNVRQDHESLEESIKVLQYASGSNRAILPKATNLITSIADNYYSERNEECHELQPFKKDPTQKLIEDAKEQIKINQIKEKMATFRQSMFQDMEENSRQGGFFNEFTRSSTFETRLESFRGMFNTGNSAEGPRESNAGGGFFATAAAFGSLSQQKTPLCMKNIQTKWG